MSTEYYGNTVVGLKLSDSKIKEYLIANKAGIEPYEFMERLNLIYECDDDLNYFLTPCRELSSCIDIKHGVDSTKSIPLLHDYNYNAIEVGIKTELDKINNKMGWIGNLWDDNDFKIWCFGHTG